MNNHLGWKFEIAAISVVLLAATGWLLFRIPGVIEIINRKYPDLGMLGWSAILLWLAGCFVLMEAVTRLCKKKKWGRFCYTEGMAAGALYLFFSSILFLLLAGNPP